MENFTSPNLNLILGVKEGCHFDRVQKPTIILATLNGQCFETKKVQPNCNPQYETDSIWETDKSALRKMRCNSTPVKVECYAVNDNGSREKLGYILLSVRSAQIIYRGEDDKIKMNWHNILGVRNEFNNCKPKLMLYLIIKERDDKKAEVSKDKELQEVISINSNIFPKWIQQKHLIQLGPLDTCQDIFLLHITAELLTNLGQLSQESRENRNDDFTLIYKIFEMYFKLKSFKLEQDSIYLNQKIVIKIRSSATVLARYLNSKSHLFIKLKNVNNNIVVAHSDIDLQSLLTSSYLQNMNQMHKNTASAMEYYCTLINVHSKECKGDYKKDDTEELPKLKICIKLLLAESKDKSSDKNDDRVSYNSQLHVPVYPDYQQCYLDKQNSYLSCNNRVRYVSSSEKILHLDKENIKSSIYNKRDGMKKTDDYRSYRLITHLKSITFTCSQPNVKIIEFRFYNPKGDVVTTISKNVSIETNQAIKLQDVRCNLHFISTPENIEKLLSTFAPKINLCDSTSSDVKCMAQVNFDVERLFRQTKLECQYSEILMNCDSQREIGSLEIFTALEDCTESPTKGIHEETSEIMFSNDVAYKIVDELETWKERQKEIFKEELLKKEETHLTLLNEEWQRRRQCLESKLNCSIEQCKMLANNLNTTTEDLKKRKIQSFEKETKLIQANEEQQWKYERKLRQLHDALEKMQAEFTLKLRTLEEQNRNLIVRIESLNAKNNKLEQIVVEQNEKLSTCKKASTPENQTTSVLQQLKNLEEKLDNAQKSKKFFKEQWDKSVKEIHKLKMENQKALQSQIKSSKEELHNFDLEEILHADSAALTYDQIALNEIQREIDVINPGLSNRYLKARSKEQLFTPQSDLCLSLDYNPMKSDLSTSFNVDERKLHMLMEERDALLKTGSYTSKDDVIVKLNADIRSLLMNS